mgnify:CR=1 FL=1
MAFALNVSTPLVVSPNRIDYLDFFYGVVNYTDLSPTLLKLLGMEGQDPAYEFEKLMKKIVTGDADGNWHPSPEEQHTKFVEAVQELWDERCDHESKRENGRGRHGCSTASAQNRHYSKLAWKVFLNGTKPDFYYLHLLTEHTDYGIMFSGEDWCRVLFERLNADDDEDNEKLLKPHMKVYFKTIFRWLKDLAENSANENWGEEQIQVTGRPHNWTADELIEKREALVQRKAQAKIEKFNRDKNELMSLAFPKEREGGLKKLGKYSGHGQDWATTIPQAQAKYLTFMEDAGKQDQFLDEQQAFSIIVPEPEPEPEPEYTVDFDAEPPCEPEPETKAVAPKKKRKFKLKKNRARDLTDN